MNQGDKIIGTTGIIIAVALAAALISGCASPRRAFEAARATDTRDSYSRFVSQFPQSEFVRAATNRIAAIDYETTIANGSATTLRTYLRTYQANTPQRLDVEARLRALEDEAFLKAKTADDAMQWAAFIQEWCLEEFLQFNTEAVSSSRYLAEAQSAMAASGERQDYIEARSKKSVEALGAFLEKWPEGAHRVEALALLTQTKSQLENSSYEHALSSRRYIDLWEHMVTHSDGTTAPRAKQALSEWKWITTKEPVLIPWDKLPYKISANLDNEGFNRALSRLAKRHANPLGLQMLECGYTRSDFTCLLQEVFFVRTNLTAHAALAQKAISPPDQGGVPPCIPITVRVVETKTMDGVWTVTFSGDQDASRVLRIGGTQSACIIPVGSALVVEPRPDQGNKNTGPSHEFGMGFAPPSSFDSLLFQRLGKSTDSFINVFGIACKSGSVVVSERGLELQKGSVFAAME